MMAFGQVVNECMACGAKKKRKMKELIIAVAAMMLGVAAYTSVFVC